MKYLIVYKQKWRIKDKLELKHRIPWYWIWTPEHLIMVDGLDKLRSYVIMDECDKCIEAQMAMFHEDMEILGISNFTIHSNAVPVIDTEMAWVEELERTEISVEFHDPKDEEEYIRYVGFKNLERIP